ncbi:hypothetical protein GCM10014713_22050 [Streptomyces purpureus]|uniref:Uncharacterized protein n=1 Tax=Streptomyces purpureus TaxID=1951 RepID=A0A918GZX7_9ACTN|nr:hypothetical protein GCM10014713_22050 [Streptomyces purpureus]
MVGVAVIEGNEHRGHVDVPSRVRRRFRRRREVEPVRQGEQRWEHPVVRHSRPERIEGDEHAASWYECGVNPRRDREALKGQFVQETD